MSENSFLGSIPHAFGNLRNLRNLNSAENHLIVQPSSSGLTSLFSSLTNCRSLMSLRLSDSLFNAALPYSVGNLSSSLQEFIAGGCAITGTLPNEIGNLSSLILLTLEDNDLQGTIPMTIGKLRNLQGLNLEFNRMQTIPFAICELQALAYLYVGINELSGTIPSCLGNLTSLRSLSMKTNRFVSTIPSTLWRLQDILEMDLSSNFLSGSLQLDIGNLKAITFLDLSRNQLSGNIPPSFGDLKDLTNLSLSTNRLEGSIPESLGDAISLQLLDLSNNSLSGEIPKSLEKLRYLTYLNVSFNELQGEIPTGGPFKNLSEQSFRGNKALYGMSKMQVHPCKTSSPNQSKKLVIILVVIGTLVLALAIVILFLNRYCKRKTMPIHQGHLLPLATWERISMHDLKQATDNFNEINLLGKGSFGSVYKGILSDGKSVAIKVYNLQSEGAFKSFEVVCEVVRRIRHRNLVKIITSCCSTEFKALVLEFMPNWSLEKWLYSDNYFLDMLERLNIMIDVASALEYLHYGGAETIAHCDLKPSNVLLDEDMVAHVSNFGIAKLHGEEKSVKP